MNKPRILLVEDEFLIRVTLAEALTDEGYEVVEAGNADEALAVMQPELMQEGALPVKTVGAADGRIGLMLTDIQLPDGMDGHALAGRMRALVPNLPVIFMSGRPTPLPDACGAPQLLIPKPYLPSEICAAVRRLLAPPG